MRTIDLRKEFKHLYQPSAKAPVLVEVPDLQFLMIDGEMEPGLLPGDSPAFAAAIGALYGAAYTLKFMFKRAKEDPVDFPVLALEGLWWADDGDVDLTRPGAWRWRLMILTPDVVTSESFETASGQLREKHPEAPVERLRLERFAEGLSVQMMHVGPYADEPRTFELMRTFAASQGFSLCGKHHEIYLGDPRRAAPEKLKTVLRHPVVATPAA